jgi:phenylacetate-CoA ligase
LIDTYSCGEFGAIALQCPVHEHYHVQSESVYVELVRDDGTACRAGEIGRVLVTSLHNFAMPLIRYELGDYAMAGHACPCGRGLPVLARVAGRQRNMALDPTGRRYWPSLPASLFLGVAPIKQFQLVQHSAKRIEILYVLERELTPAEQGRLSRALAEALRYAYDFDYRQVGEIDRMPGAKYEDFVSRLAEH